MGRRKRTAREMAAGSAPKPPATGIDPLAVYRLADLPGLIRVGFGVVREAVRSGELRCKIAGNRQLFLGQWLLDWVERPTGQTVHAGGAGAPEAPERP